MPSPIKVKQFSKRGAQCMLFCLFVCLFLIPPYVVDSDSKTSAYNAEDLGSIPGPGRSPEKEMVTHFSILAWKFPWTEEPGRLQFMGLQRVRHDWVTSLLRWFECVEGMRTDALEHFQSTLSPQSTFPPSFVDRRVAFMERTLDSGRRGPALGMWGLAVALLSVLLSIIHRVRRLDLWGPASPFCTALQVPRLLNCLSRWLQVCFWGPWGLLPGARHIVVLCLFRASRNNHFWSCGWSSDTGARCPWTWAQSHLMGCALGLGIEREAKQWVRDLVPG